jgi:ribosomal protein S18 acetylase RimI-like enzyme
MKDVDIRTARPDDASAISRLHTRSFRAAYEHLPDTRRSLEAGEERRSAFWQEILARKDESTLLAIVDDRLIGFIRIGPSPDDDSDETTGHIFSVHVDPDLTGSGVGSQLVEAAVSALSREHRTATLWALRENEPAHRFYEHLGWRRDGAVGTEKLSIGEDDGDDVEVIRFHRDLVAKGEVTD